MTVRRNALRLAAVGAALIAVVTGAFWLQHNQPALPSSAAPSARSSVDVPTIHAETDDAAEVVNATQVEGAPSPAARPVIVGRDTDADLERQLAESMYDKGGGSSVVDYLVTRGLARSDGELVARKAFSALAACWFDALRVESTEQSVSYDSLLDAVDAVLHDADGPEMAALIDVRAVTARATPCSLNVVQQAGLPLAVGELL